MSNRATLITEVGIVNNGVSNVFYKNINTLLFYPVFYAGSYSDAENLTALRYTWSFGDGTSSSGNTVSKMYDKTGEFDVSLYIYENGGLVRTLTKTILIKNVIADNLEIQNIPDNGTFQTNQSVPLSITINYTTDETTSMVDGFSPVVELYSRGSFSEPRVSVEKWSHLIPQWYFTNTNDVLVSKVELNGTPLYSDLSGNTSFTKDERFSYLVGTTGSFVVKYVDDLPTYEYSRPTDEPVTLFFGLNSINKKKDIDSTIYPSYANAGVLFPEKIEFSISNIIGTRKFKYDFDKTLVANSIINVNGLSNRTIAKAYLVDSDDNVTSEELFLSVLGENGEFSFNIKANSDSERIIFEYDGSYDVAIVDLSYGVINLVAIPKGIKVFVPVTVKRLEPNALSITKDGKSIDVSAIQWIGVKSRFFATMVDSDGIVLKNYPIGLQDTENKTVNFSLIADNTLAQGIFEYNSGSFVYSDDVGRRYGGFIKNWFKPYFYGTDYKVKANGILKYYKNELTVVDNYNFKNSIGDFGVINNATVKRSISGIYCSASGADSGIQLSHPFSVGQSYNFDVELYYISGATVRLESQFGIIIDEVPQGVTQISYTPSVSGSSIYLATNDASGDFVVKSIRVYQDVAEKTFDGYSKTFGVYDLDKQKTVRKINQTVDMSGLLKSYALQEQLHNSNVLWNSFASTVFGTLSSDTNSMGNTFFEKIGNFFENHVSIDTGEMRAIDSINLLLGETSDKYISDVPLALNKLLNVISINDKDLIGSADKYKRNYLENYNDPNDVTSNIVTTGNKDSSILDSSVLVLAGDKYVFNTKYTTNYETVEIPKAQASWKNFPDVDPFIAATPLSSFPLIEYPLSAVRHGLLDYPVFSYYDVFKFRDVSKGDVVGNILDFSLPEPLSGFSREEIASTKWSSEDGIQDLLIDNVISNIVLTYDVSDYVPIEYPSVVLTSAYPTILNSFFTVTATFSNQMSGFDELDVTTTNAVVSDFQNTATDIYTFKVTPISDGNVTVYIDNGVSQNYNGLGNTASNVMNFTYDTVPPEVSITNTTPDPITGKFTINIKFSEIVTNFTTDSLTLTNCTVSNHVVITDMEHEYLVTPITTGAISVEILPNTIRDLAGNYNQ